MVTPAARLVALVAVAASCAAAVSCKRAPEPDATGTEPHPSPAATTAHVTKSAPSEIAWDVPSSWQKAENPSPMRLFTYKIPKAAGDPEDAELSISRAGGSIEANVQRWSSQFERTAADAVQRKERTIHDLKVTTVEIHGTFSGGGMPGGPPSAPKPKFALLGAIVEAGATPYFFKLTGPDKTVTAAKHDFDQLVESFRPK